MPTAAANTTLQLCEISAALNVPVDKLVSLCETAIPPIAVRYSRTGQRVIAIADLLALADRASQPRTRTPPAILDRVHMLIWLCGLRNSVRVKPRSYSMSLEMEINRIARLPEPMRTARAFDLLGRYCDAKALADGVKLAQQEQRVQERVGRKLGELAESAGKG